MKKIFMILAAIAMVSMVACKKDDNKKDNKKDSEETTETSIKVDGDFSDWSAIKSGVSSCELGEENAYPGLLAMKAYADEDNLFIYFEYEIQEEQGNGAPIDIFVNADNNTATGGVSWLYTDDGMGYEFFVESEIGFLENNNAAVRNMTDMAVYSFTGQNGTDAWDDVNGDNGLTKKDVQDFCESAGKVSNGIAKVEISILRSVINATKKGTIGLGISTYFANWKTSGVLPQGAAVGAEALMDVTLP